MNEFVIFVNTCDKFEDCWDPFFKLFSTHWPDYQGTIYLNTEYKEYTYPGLNIVSVKSCEGLNDAHLITWSECLKRGLSAIDNELVLYLQEDYFLKSKVNDNAIFNFAKLMRSENIDCVHLTDQNTQGPFTASSPYEGLWTINQESEYRISCQAAIWKREVLSSYIRTYESAWNFEDFGTTRSSVLNHKFYMVDRTQVKLNVSEIIPYVFTGIIKGKWLDEVVPLFKKHQIIIDFSKRGITNNKEPKTLRTRIENRIKRLPNYFRNQIDMVALRRSQNRYKG